MTLFFLGTLLSLAILSCEKDKFTLTDAENEKETPLVFDPYETSRFSQEEQARIAIAQVIGTKIRTDEDFRVRFFNKLVYEKGRATKDYFLLDFLGDKFNGLSGAQILQEAEVQSLQKSAINLADYAATMSPEMVFKIPKYVESFFWVKEVIEEEVSIFANVPLAVFPETGQANAQGYFLGYGDEVEGNNGVYGVESGDIYDGYIPIHIKRSRNHIILNSRNETREGVPIKNYIRKYWSGDGLNCLETTLLENTVPQDFLNPDEKLINYPKLLHDMIPCLSDADQVNYIVPVPPREICNNGVDDDGDGLTDEEDPDCSGRSEEICDNGVDDDGDGLVDEEDPDCFTCPDGATYYRDCEKDFNAITGVRFNNVNYYFDIYNQFLPGIEDNLNLRFDFFYLTNIPGCNTNCPLNTSFQISSNPGLMIFPDPEIAALGDGWHIEIDDEFEAFFSPGLNNGNPGHFIVKAQTKDAPPPFGSRLIGRIGNLNFDPFGNIHFDFELVGYIINTNWIPMHVPYMNVGDQEWNAQFFGDHIKARITETDPFSSLFQDQNGTMSNVTRNWNIGLSGTIGQLFGADTAPGAANPNVGYSFGNSQTISGSQTYTLTAQRIYELADVTLTYQDFPDDDRPVDNNIGPLGLGQGDNMAWGTEDLNKFYFESTGKVNLLHTTPLKLIDLIRVEE